MIIIINAVLAICQHRLTLSWKISIPMGYQIPKFLFVALCLSLVGCGLSNLSTSDPSEQVGSSPMSAPMTAKSIKIVATVLPMYWFTKAVVGDTADVSLLVPPTAEVHEYQATPDNVRAIAEAQVLVKNGLGLEAFLTDTIANAGNQNLTQIDTTKGIEALGAISPVIARSEPKSSEAQSTNDNVKADDHGHGGGEHAHTGRNPHVWIDPVIAEQQVAAIRDGLIAVAPENKAIYQANAAAYIKQLKQLNTQYVQALQPHQGCAFITFHDAYSYLARRYQLKQVAVVAMPEDSVSPAEIKQTIDLVRQCHVKALFGEPGVDNKLLQSLAQDLNLTLQVIDPLERGKLDLGYYFQVMETNLKTLIAACQAQRKADGG